MRIRAVFTLAFMTTLAASNAYGEVGTADDSEPLEKPPEPLDRTRTDEELEPTVTIKERDRVTVYEYRLNGLLYAVKVVPKNAPAYYLVDSDGDGLLETRSHDLTAPEINRIPAWVLFRW